MFADSSTAQVIGIGVGGLTVGGALSWAIVQIVPAFKERLLRPLAKPGAANGNGNGYAARFDEIKKSVGDLRVSIGDLAPVLKELAAATNRIMDWVDKQDKAQEQADLADAVAAKLRHGKAASV